MKEQAQDIIENLEMVTPPEPFQWLIPAIIALAVLLAIGAVVFVLYRKKRLPFQEAHSVPPGRTAMEALAGIRHLIEAGQVREFVMEVSKILRYYLEGRFSLAAPHLSTEEFLHLAESNDALDTEHRAGIAAFLVQCDRVKFALAGLEKDAMQNLYDVAENFIRQTEKPPDTTPEPAAS